MTEFNDSCKTIFFLYLKREERDKNKKITRRRRNGKDKRKLIKRRLKRYSQAIISMTEARKELHQHSSCLHCTPISVHLHSRQVLESSVIILPTRYILPYMLQPANFRRLLDDVPISLSDANVVRV